MPKASSLFLSIIMLSSTPLLNLKVNIKMIWWQIPEDDLFSVKFLSGYRLQFRDVIFTAFSSFPNTCCTVLGLPSLNTSWLQYFIENSAICVIIGFNASPFSVIAYSTLTGYQDRLSFLLDCFFHLSQPDRKSLGINSFYRF